MNTRRDPLDVPPELERHTANALSEFEGEVAQAEAQAMRERSWGPLIRAAPAIATLDDASTQELYERMHMALPPNGIQPLKAAVKKERRNAIVPSLIHDGRPRIVINNEQLDTNVRRAAEALRIWNGDKPTVFVRAGELVQVTYRDGVPGVSVLTWPELKQLLSEVAIVVRTTPGGDEFADATDALVGALAKHVGKMDPPPLPPLAAIIEAPAMRPAGSLIVTPGYDADTGYFYHVAPGFEVEHVEIDAARAFILEVIAEFPWLDEASRANAIALLVTPFIRPAVTGLVPLALITSPIPGAGKNLLMHLVAIAATGRPAATRLLSESHDEAKKEVFSALLGGRPLIFFDEVTSLEAPALLHALTAPIVEGRLLGVSRDASARNEAIWAAAALGQPKMARGTARRVYPIELDPDTIRPWEQNFRRPDLVGYLMANRGRLVGSIVALMRNWVEEKRPGAPNESAKMGQFGPWRNLVGGIVHAAGLGTVLATQHKIYMNGEDASWARLLRAIHADRADAPFTVSDLMERVAASTSSTRDPIVRALASAYPVRAKKSHQGLGKALSKRAGIALLHEDGTYELVVVGTAHGGASKYRVVGRELESSDPTADG